MRNLPSFDPSKQKSVPSPKVRTFENISNKRLDLKNMEAKLPVFNAKKCLQDSMRSISFALFCCRGYISTFSVCLSA